MERTHVSAARSALLLALLASACSGADRETGLDEPIIAHEADFKKGKLPGTKEDADPVANRPIVFGTDLASTSFHAGTPNVPFSGTVSEDTYAVGGRLLDQGTGYWVRPVGAEDPLQPGVLTWQLPFDVGGDAEPGKHKLGIVAFDAKGRPGQQQVLDVCVKSEVPDNDNVCDPSKEPPKAVATLRWNTEADLDLLVIGPDGTRYSRSNFAQVRNDNVVARLDADGVSGCQLDGRQHESFIWNEGEKPQSGTWYIYTNLFDACGKAAVRFEITTYRSKQHDDGTFSLEEQKTVGGELLRAQTNPDDARPLYVTKIEFP